jgi:predicted permease
MAFWSKLALNLRGRRDRELEEELAIHLRMATSDIGEDAARRQFGNVGLIREVTRGMWRFASWEAFQQDVRYALRVLGKNPGYLLTGVLSLALGIGANTAIFSLIDTIMLKSLPVSHPEELVSIGDPSSVGRVHGGSIGDVDIFSYPFYLRLREQNSIFTGVYAAGRSEQLNLEDSSEHPLARLVSDNYFSVLGVTPLLGRTFEKADEPVVIISFDYWERHFQRAPDVVGRKLRVNGAAFTIIGVTPREFFGDVVGFPSDLWFPIEMQPRANPGRNYLNKADVQWLLLMGRLKPGVSLAQAEAVTNTVGLGILKQELTSPALGDLKSLGKKRIAVQPAAGGFSHIRHAFSKPLFLLMILVGLVMLICCTNVANLQLARATSRAREIGLRLAIGASRGRLLRQLMTESLVLAVAGGAAGLLLAVWIGHLLLGLIARDDRLPLEFHLSGTTLLFTLALSITASLFFGLAPAFYATKASVFSNLKESKSGRSHGGAQRFEKGLVVFQIVLSWVLLFGSGLFIRTLQNLENSDVGYRRDQLLVVELDPLTSGYKGERLIQLGTRLLDKLNGSPGIRRVTISENGLFSGTESISGLQVPGFIARSDEDKLSRFDRVGPGYFETIGTPILAGRGIEARDMANAAKVAVLNEAMARFYFPNVNPLGRRISTDDGKTWVTVIGVVRDAKQNNLREPAIRRFYSQFAPSNDDPISSMRLEFRADGPRSQAEALIRRQIKSVDPKLQIASIAAAQTLIENELLQERLIAKLSSAFSLLALLLAAIGLYGVMSYLTQRRTMEMGIRLALGASRGSVTSMILREALTVTLSGLAVAIVAAAFLGKLVANSLYGVAASDPLTAGLASIAILAAAFLAGWFPAHRASRVDPMIALRTE